MSSFVAEASVVIRPVADPKVFTAAVESAIAAAQAAAKPILVPITPVVGGTAATAGLAELTAAQTAAETSALGLASAAQVEASAFGQLAVPLAAVTAGEDAAGAASEKLAGAQTIAAGATKRLAVAQSAGVKASSALAGTYAEVASAASAVGAAEVQHTRAAAAVAVAEGALTKALATSNIALIDAASNALVLARNREAETVAALRAARAEAEHAATLAAVGKAGIATGAGMLGLRGAVLTAGAAFIAAVAGLQTLKKSIGEASALNEEINKNRVVFRRASEAILEWSKTTASAMGISRVAALQAAGQFGNILVPMGVLPEKAAILSQSLVRLASDMASFNNVGTDRALEAIRAGLVGQSRPLRVLGVQLTAARVEQEAFRQTGKKSADALTQQDKILARYSLILKDSAIQAGDFAATQDRLANSARILSAQLSDLGGEIGSVTIPALTGLVGALNDTIRATEETIAGVSELAAAIAKSSPARFVIQFVEEIPGVPLIEKQAKDAGTSFGTIFKIAAGAALVAGGGLTSEFGVGLAAQAAGFPLLVSGLEDLKKAGEEAPSSLEGLHQSLVKIQKDALELGGPAGIAKASGDIQNLIAVFSRGGPVGKEFARTLAGILADLQTGKLKLNAKIDLVAIFDQAQARTEVEKKWGVFRDSVERGIELQPPIEAKVKVNVSFDLRTAAAEAAGPAAALAEAKRQQAAALKSIRALLGLDPNATRAEINAVIQSRKIATDRQDALGRAFARLRASDAVISGAAREAASAAETARNKQEQAAKDAATARANATRAFIDSFLAGKETLLRRRLERAANTETVADDLRINQGIRRILAARLRAIRERIRNLHLHGDALKIAQAAIKTLGDQIASLDATIARETDDLTKQRQAAKAAARDAAIRHQEALLAIAEAQGNVANERAALQRIIALDTARINFLKNKRKKTQEEKDELDALLVDRAQRNQALRELTKETNKGKSDAQKLLEAEFAFLQTQQGFTASLIGNLIPGGLTSGLVGGTASAAATAAAGPRQVAGGFEQPRGPMASAVGPRPVSQGQGNTQIALLREIRNLLRKLNMGIEHPEAKNQRSTGAAAMDYSRSDMAMGIG